jgi:hypothetical protein
VAVAESEHFERWMQNSLPVVSPATPADLRVELEAARDDPEQQQIVRIDNPMAWLMEPVKAGLPGKPLLVEILCNTGPLTISDGHAVIFVNTKDHYEIVLRSKSVVEVIIAPGSTASVTVGGQAKATIVVRTGGRGNLHMTTAIASGEVRGDTSNFWVSDAMNRSSRI